MRWIVLVLLLTMGALGVSDGPDPVGKGRCDANGEDCIVGVIVDDGIPF